MRVATILSQRQAQLTELWAGLERTGPTFGSPDAGSREQARRRYLIPLARLLIGALQGSASHTAVYLDERLRYVESSTSADNRRTALRRALAIETRGIAQLLSDSIPEEITTNVLDSLHESLLRQAQARLKLLFVGDCLFVETRAFLIPEMQRRGCSIDVNHVFFSAGQQLADLNTALTNEIRRYKPDVIGISQFTFEASPLYRAAWRTAATRSGKAESSGYINGLMDALEVTIRDIRTITDATIVLHGPGGLPLDRFRRRVPFGSPHSAGQRRILDEIGAQIHSIAEGNENVVLIDERDLFAEAGGLRALARPLFSPADVPAGYSHPSRVGPEIARRYGNLLLDWDLLGKAKVLLVDFDNTLWSGVMGDGPVDHYVDRQRLLRDLRAAGVLLVALSKNDPALIRWDEMHLDQEDFALQKINWAPKADNVSAAIAELDLAPDSFVMIDDNPVERALVSDNVPGVRTLDGADSDAWVTLRRWLKFPSTAQTVEAAHRTKMYREAASRRTVTHGTSDYPTMMRSLHLKYSVHPATKRDLVRVVELIQRTNQFNTSTKRRSLDDVAALLQSDGVGLYVASLSDRFGDLGLVGVVVFDRGNSHFESVIMSCRAMGFGLEIAMLSDVMAAEGGSHFLGSFSPSDRNRPAADLFERAGFAPIGDDEWELIEGMPLPSVPHWLSR